MADLVANGVRFNVLRMGPPDGVPRDRPAVVFLHGLIMDNLSSWYYTLAPTVSRQTDVVLYDLRGHGRSERAPSGYRIEDAVDDLFAIVDAAGIEGPVDLVGNSFGGTIALAAAVLAPERVASMALVEAHPAFLGWADDMVQDLEDLVERFHDPAIRDYLARVAPRKIRTIATQCEQLVNATSLPDDFLASSPTTPDVLARIQSPTLLLYGEASDIIEQGHELAEAIPRAELRVFEDCSHSLLIEASALVEAHVVPWLEEQARAAFVDHRVERAS